MINHQEIKNLEIEWGLREDVIEKDYVIGWLLWGIGSDPVLGEQWAFKGGTALKKCFTETWRFSEDLDFTVIVGGPDIPDTIEPILHKILERVHEESGIDFFAVHPTFKHTEKYRYTEGSIYYRGPRNARKPARIKLDISGAESIVRPTVLRGIVNPYTDSLPAPAQVRCYAFEEVFAEKLRAMGERGRPRDLYDIILLFRRKDLQSQPQLIQSILLEKCEFKGISAPTLESIQNSPFKDELVNEWDNMLGHQLPNLPPFQQFWDELPELFNWLNGAPVPARIAAMPVSIEYQEDTTWSPPPTIRQWGLGIPLESIRFAAVNRLCVELGYQRTVRLIEPYSLRRTKDGHLILHAVKTQTGEPRAYRVDRIESVKVTNIPYIPKFEIEFYSVGPFTRNR